MSELRSSLVAACCVVGALFAGTAEANCQTFLAPFFQHASQAESFVGFSYVSMQQSNVVGFAISDSGAPGKGMMRKNASGQLDSRNYASSQTWQVFSDRRDSNGQPFWNGAHDLADLVVAPDGDVWLISNTWGVTTFIDNPTCANGVLYGFGPPIGSYQIPALYVFSFFKTAEIR